MSREQATSKLNQKYSIEMALRDWVHALSLSQILSKVLYTTLGNLFCFQSGLQGYMYNSKYSRLCLPSSPSSSGRVTIISTSSHSYSSRQGRSHVVCFLAADPSPCCPPAQARTCGQGCWVQLNPSWRAAGC